MYTFSGLFNAEKEFKQRLNMRFIDNDKEYTEYIEEIARGLRLQLRTIHTSFKDFEKEYFGLSVIYILDQMDIIREGKEWLDNNTYLIDKDLIDKNKYGSLTKEEKLEINKYYLIKSREFYKFLGEYIKEGVQRKVRARNLKAQCYRNNGYKEIRFKPKI